MRDEDRRLEVFLLLLLALFILNLLDSTARYLTTYYAAREYLPSTYLKPLVLAGNVVLAALFAVTARGYVSGAIMSARTLEGVAFVSVAVGLLFLDTKVLPLLRVPVPFAVVDLAWFTLYVLPLVVFPALLAGRVRKAFGLPAAAVLLVVAVAFGTNLMNHLYFWIQNVLELSPPYAMVLAGMFVPAAAMAFAAFVALAIELKRRSIKVASVAFLALMAAPLLPLIPITLQLTGLTLPNLILRGWTFWSLGYTGYVSSTPGLIMASLGAYLFLLIRNSSHDPAGRLLFLALLTFPLNGVFILFLDYSSIPGNLLSLAAAGIALDIIHTRREAR